MFALKFEGEDTRGKVWSFMIGDIEYILFFTKAGCLRGGDFHSAKQYNTVLQGTIEFIRSYDEKSTKSSTWIIIKKDSIDGVRLEVHELVHEGQTIVTAKNIPHYMISKSDSWVLEWHELPKTRKIYSSYRKLVEESKKIGRQK